MIDSSGVALAWTAIDPSGVAGEYNDFKKRKKGGVKKCLPCWAELMADLSFRSWNWRLTNHNLIYNSESTLNLNNNIACCGP
jgi:hypothetical protein